MVLIVGNDHAVNIEIEEVNKIFCDRGYKCVVIEMKDKTHHIFKTSDMKRFFDYVCKALKPIDT
jgi:predicted RNA-binding protein associated with RNAse of E/G family